MAIREGDVTDAALAVLQRDGLDALSLRSVADHLGVRHNTVRWHIDTKAHLLELMSDRILAGCAAEPLPEIPVERARMLYGRLRDALRECRDGARLLAGVFTTGPETLAFAERAITTFIDAGRSPREATWLHWSAFYFALGLTTEEQADRHDRSANLAQALSAGTYPTLAAVAAHLISNDFDQRFEYGLDALLKGSALPAGTPHGGQDGSAPTVARGQQAGEFGDRLG